MDEENTLTICKDSSNLIQQEVKPTKKQEKKDPLPRYESEALDQQDSPPPLVGDDEDTSRELNESIDL